MNQIQHTVAYICILVLLILNSVSCLAPCTFPFMYVGEMHHTCVTDQNGQSFCNTTSYERRLCADPPSSAKLNSRCHIPFMYGNKSHESCLYDLQGSQWCGVTADTDSDGHWTQCQDKPNGEKISTNQPCVFPFTFEGKTYGECISYNYDGKPWCSLTADYDTDKRWRDCHDSTAADICHHSSLNDHQGQVVSFLHSATREGGVVYTPEHAKVCSITIPLESYQAVRLTFPFLDVAEECSVNASTSSDNEVEIRMSNNEKVFDYCKPHGNGTMHIVEQDAGKLLETNFVIIYFYIRNNNFRGFVMNYEILDGCSSDDLVFHDHTIHHLMNRTHIQYECFPGYKLKDERSRVIICDIKKGVWSAPPGECVLITCPIPKSKNQHTGLVHHGDDQHQFKMGDIVSFTCSHKKILRGNKTIMCTSNGTWSADYPVCSDPGSSENNQVDYGSLIAGILSVLLVLAIVTVVTLVVVKSRFAQDLWNRFSNSRGQHRPVNQDTWPTDDRMQYSDLADSNTDSYDKVHRQRQNGSGSPVKNSTIMMDSDSDAELVENEALA